MEVLRPGLMPLWHCMTLGLAVTLGLPPEVFGAEAQSYPSRPIRFIVPSPAGGGGADLYARLIGRKLTDAWGYQVISDNRPGAGGSIAAAMVAKAPADGYTFFLGHPNTLTVGPALRSKRTYDPVNDFQPITILMTAPSMLSVHPGSPLASVSDLIATAKKRPGEVSYGTSGTGSVGNMIGELLSQITNIKLLHVAYKGAAPALFDLSAGRINFVSSSLASQIGLVRDGRIRAIATTGAKRARLSPNVPTVAESGIPGFDVTAWHGMLVPAKVPRPIVTKLHQEVIRILTLPDVQDILLMEGGDIAPTSPEEFHNIIRTEFAKWEKVVRQSGIAVD